MNRSVSAGSVIRRLGVEIGCTGPGGTGNGGAGGGAGRGTSATCGAGAACGACGAGGDGAGITSVLDTNIIVASLFSDRQGHILPPTLCDRPHITVGLTYNSWIEAWARCFGAKLLLTRPKRSPKIRAHSCGRRFSRIRGVRAAAAPQERSHAKPETTGRPGHRD